MTWQFLNARHRELRVAGEADGVPIFTREDRDALSFQTADLARAWMRERLMSVFGELALMRVAGHEPRRPSHYGRRT